MKIFWQKTNLIAKVTKLDGIKIFGIRFGQISGIFLGGGGGGWYDAKKLLYSNWSMGNSLLRLRSLETRKKNNKAHHRQLFTHS